jgi:hypothetical protein
MVLDPAGRGCPLDGLGHECADMNYWRVAFGHGLFLMVLVCMYNVLTQPDWRPWLSATIGFTGWCIALAESDRHT